MVAAKSSFQRRKRAMTKKRASALNSGMEGLMKEIGKMGSLKSVLFRS